MNNDGATRWRCGWIVPVGHSRSGHVPWRAAGRVHGVFRVVLRCTNDTSMELCVYRGYTIDRSVVCIDVYVLRIRT